MLIAIDPGAHGAIVYDDDEGRVQALKMPPDYTEVVDALRDLAVKGGQVQCIMEKVAPYKKGNGGKGAGTFGSHLGTLKTALYCIGIPTEFVAPTVWQRGISVATGDKDAIKIAMAALYPHLRVTLANADALGIYTWAKRRGA